MNHPIVTVVIPTYNYAQFILEAINSIFNQTYPSDKIEIIVVDDGSIDDTKEVLSSLVNDRKIHYYHQQNKGKASATYLGIQKSSGKYIFNLDADDYFFTDKIFKTVNAFESDVNIVHVGTPAKIFHEDTKVLMDYEKIPINISGKSLDGNWLLQYFYNNNLLFGGGSTYAARASVLKGINIPAGVDMYIDEFLILALLPYGKSFFIEEALSIWRNHGSNYSASSSTFEKKVIKEQRLAQSSTAVLDYLQKNNFDNKLIKIYKIKDLNRAIALKETLETKKLSDIFSFVSEVFFILKPDILIIKKYKILNRLIPMTVYKLLKSLTKKTA
ncbi:MAG: glycosyl transferase, group 2 [Mucilaginibacter sp.]|nr:glycosyl transferase, group 2 [Mucilaginibacter sp.]